MYIHKVTVNLVLSLSSICDPDCIHHLDSTVPKEGANLFFLKQLVLLPHTQVVFLDLNSQIYAPGVVKITCEHLRWVVGQPWMAVEPHQLLQPSLSILRREKIR